jgi:putative tricarboxylic transport membrane protein
MSDRTLGVVCVVVAGAMAWAATGYNPPISYEPVGPKSFPLLLAALMACAGVWLVLKPTLTLASWKGTPWRLIGLCAGAVLAYSALFEWLGFPLATALMTVPVGLAFGGDWKKTLLAGIVLGLTCYVLFDKVLDVVLPTGMLSFLLGGR